MVTLNRIVAVAMVHGAQEGLRQLAATDADDALTGHHRVNAVRGHLLEMVGDREAARAAYFVAARRTLSIPGAALPAGTRGGAQTKPTQRLAQAPAAGGDGLGGVRRTLNNGATPQNRTAFRIDRTAKTPGFAADSVTAEAAMLTRKRVFPPSKTGGLTPESRYSVEVSVVLVSVLSLAITPSRQRIASRRADRPRPAHVRSLAAMGQGRQRSVLRGRVALVALPTPLSVGRHGHPARDWVASGQ